MVDYSAVAKIVGAECTVQYVAECPSLAAFIYHWMCVVRCCVLLLLVLVGFVPSASFSFQCWCRVRVHAVCYDNC